MRRKGLTRGVVQAVAVLMVVMAATASVHGAQPEMDGLTGGDRPWERAFDEAMLDGRQHYNAGNFDEAKDAFVGAVQRLPKAAAPYRNLARTYNHMGRFDEATEYYDIYLRMAPDADDAETIAAERRGAVERTSDEPWRLPGDQRIARRALERELADGWALTAGDGGAWGLYQTLLKLGYARPDLEEFRDAIEERLYEELKEGFERVDDFLPVLDGQGWALQHKRLEALAEVTRSSERLDEIERAMDVVDVGLALFDGDYETVDARAEMVMERGAEFDFVGWYRVVALERMERPESALQVLLELRRDGVFEGEGERRLEAMRARLLQQLGGDEEAAQIYYQILTGSR